MPVKRHQLCFEWSAWLSFRFFWEAFFLVLLLLFVVVLFLRQSLLAPKLQTPYVAEAALELLVLLLPPLQCWDIRYAPSCLSWIFFHFQAGMDSGA